MNGLHELQQTFVRSVLSEEARVADRIKADGLDPVQRLAIYRNNTYFGLTEALRDSYPVVNRLVGDGFFNGLARGYIRHHPPRDACLLEYGDRFAAFVAAYPPARALPYLPDVAWLEWLWQEAFHEADATGMDLAALAAVPAECHGALRFKLDPTVRMMASDYPVLHIWEVNQPGFPGDDIVSLQEGGCRLLLFRAGLEVEIHAVEPGDYALLTALARDSMLADALEQAFDADPHFDLFTCLGYWIARGLFTRLSLKQENLT